MKTVNDAINQAAIALLCTLVAFSGLWLGTASADTAILLQEAVLVERNPAPPPEGITFAPAATPAEAAGATANATYVSEGGWAVTASAFIDATVMLFDMGENNSVSQATLTLPVEETFPQNGTTPIDIFFFSDTGVISVSDYRVGFSRPFISLDAEGLSSIQVDVTGPVNAMLEQGRFVGFRIVSNVLPTSVAEGAFPAWTGVKFTPDFNLEFTPGPAVVASTSNPFFDGFTLSVPQIEVNTVGEVQAQLKLANPNTLRFELTQATVLNATATQPALSGMDLLNCNAFPAPIATGDVPDGTSSFSISSGILDIPNVDFNGEQVAMRLELIEGSSPAVFETLSINAVSAGPSVAVSSALTGEYWLKLHRILCRYATVGY